MYKINSDLAQRRSRQLWLADLQGKAFEELPPEEQRGSLKRAWKATQERLVKLPKNSKERAELGQQVNDLQMRMNAIRPKRTGPPNTAELFLEVCKERMNKFIYKQYMEEAVSRSKRGEQT